MGRELTVTSDDLVMSFSNDTKEDMYIIIDPPVQEFILAPGANLKLIIVDYINLGKDMNDIVDVRYEKGGLNIDVNYGISLIVEIGGEKEQIWTWKS